MKKATEEQLNETYTHIKPYMKHQETIKELKEMCNICEAYYGDDHDYQNCENKMCFKCWLAFQYLEWSNSFK